MGFLDFLLTDQQKKDIAARKIGLDSGLFVMCPVCHGVTEARNQEGLRDKTQQLVHQLITRRDPSISLFGGDEQALLDTIDKVAKKLPYHCTCESI
jgi:hypothetical protein